MGEPLRLFLLPRRSPATREALTKPAVRAKMREARIGVVVGQETRAKMAEARRKLWADPAKRAKMLAGRGGS